jgi:hypothetical protein
MGGIIKSAPFLNNIRARSESGLGILYFFEVVELL